MIRSLQRRFVLTAMLSLFVLLTILIGSIIGVSYFVMERGSDQALEKFASDVPPPPPPNNDNRALFFGYQVNPNSAFYSNHYVVVNAEQVIVSIDEAFNSTYDTSDIQAYVFDILEGGKTKGKIRSFKYALTQLNDGNYRINLLDMSSQTEMLANTVLVSGSIGLACMVLMFIILILISRRTVRPIANNIDRQRHFVTDAGHEIKTPLAIIQANIDAMELHLGDNKWSKHIREQTVRLDGLMRQLLSLSQMDEGKMVHQFEDFEFSDLVDKYVALFSEANAKKRITAHVSPSVSFCGNKGSMEQLVLILMDNAVKYSTDSGDIIVKLYSVGKKSVFEVINICSELPDIEPHALFDRFYRADNARTQKNGGYGIGLSIAYAIVESHRGKITAHYDDKQTIRFRVEL